MEYSKYERARLIGARALQLSMGAPFNIDISKKELEQMRFSPVKIAMKEYEEGALKISINPLQPKKP